MRTLIIPLVFAGALTVAAGFASAVPTPSVHRIDTARESQIVQVHTGRFACHLTRHGWKRDTRPYSKPCPQHHRYRCWGHRNCWYRY